MNVRRWWKDNCQDKIKFLVQNPVSFQTSNKKYQMKFPGIESEPSGEKAALTA